MCRNSFFLKSTFSISWQLSIRINFYIKFNYILQSGVKKSIRQMFKSKKAINCWFINLLTHPSLPSSLAPWLPVFPQFWLRCNQTEKDFSAGIINTWWRGELCLQLSETNTYRWSLSVITLLPGIIIFISYKMPQNLKTFFQELKY